MERVTFPTTEVQQGLAKIEHVRLDIDDATNAAAVRRYGEAAVPTFALVDGDGNLVHRWTGGSDAAGFVAKLEQAIAEHADPDQRSRREVLDRLLVALQRGDDAASTADAERLGCQLGMQVVDEAGTIQVTAEADVVACVREWLTNHRDRLRWRPEGRRFQVME